MHHNSNYPHTNSRSRSPHQYGSPVSQTRVNRVSFRPPTPQQPHAQISLLDSVNAVLGNTGS
jgi:hypothetical protein